MTYHPDKGGDEAVFREIAEAYETLSDQEKKSNYDKYGHAGAKQNFRGNYEWDHHGDFFRGFGFNPFNDINQNNRSYVQKGPDLNLSINLTLEEVFNGTTKKFKYKRNVSCDDCSGSGGTGSKTCTNCNGTGQTIEVFNTPFGQIRNATICNVCNGKKTVVENVCNSCGGEGVKQTEELVEIKIPHGIEDGMRMTLSGKGNSIKNGIAGNLNVNLIILPHDNFIKSGSDLIMKIKLTYPQLVLGDKIDITTIDNTKIRLQINSLTKVGEVLRVQNKGLRHFNSNNRGDLLLNIDLLMPEKISDEEKIIIESLKKLNEKVETT